MDGYVLCSVLRLLLRSIDGRVVGLLVEVRIRAEVRLVPGFRLVVVVVVGCVTLRTRIDEMFLTIG